MEQLINITDAVFLGHVGEVELGASALAGIYYLATYMLGFGFSIGLQVMIARRNGEQNYAETGRTFFQGLFFLSGLALSLCLLIQGLSPFLLKQLITSPEIYQAVTDYLDWRSFGLLFSFPFLALRAFFVGIIKTRSLSWAAIAAVLINIPFNYLLIFTLKFGIAGSAIASTLAEMGSLIILLIHMWRKIDKNKYEIWEDAGAKINLVGSLRTGLLMKHRDIDFHIYSSALNLTDSFQAMARLAENPSIKRIECANLLHTAEACIEWHAWYQNEENELWQMDMIHIREGSRYDGYFEKVAQRISEIMTDEIRETILRLKYETPETEKIIGVEYYQAVIRDGVRDYSGFKEWRKQHPVTGVVEWMP